jgi:hypothetical protein
LASSNAADAILHQLNSQHTVSWLAASKWPFARVEGKRKTQIKLINASLSKLSIYFPNSHRYDRAPVTNTRLATLVRENFNMKLKFPEETSIAYANKTKVN